MLVESTLHGNSVSEVRKQFDSMRSELDWKKSRLLVEKAMFPDNKKVQNEFEQVFKNEGE